VSKNKAAMSRVDRLAWLLEEHECWEHQEWISLFANGATKAGSVAVVLQVLSRSEFHNGLRDAIAEVESGAVLGSPDRCAVCGVETRTRELGACCVYLCQAGVNNACQAVFHGTNHETGDDLIRAIIRARKAYHRATSKVPTVAALTCWKCSNTVRAKQHAGKVWCQGCLEDCASWLLAQNEVATARETDCAHKEARKEARKAKRRRVLLGLERGDDPQLIGTCGDNTFDPWRRG